MTSHSPNPARAFGLRCGLAAALLAAAGCGGNHPTTPLVLPPLASVSVSPDTLDVQVGQSRYFTVVAYDSSGHPVSQVPFQWSSSDSAGVILSVNSAGRVTGIGEGSAMVFAAAGGLRDTALVSVSPTQSGWFLQVSNTSANLNAVWFRPDGRSGWAVGDAGKIVATTDAGAHWTPQSSGTGFSLQGVGFTTANEGWAVGNNGTVLHTVDAGAHWSLMVNVGTSATLMDVTFATDSIGWAVGSGGVILRTTDRGATWTKRFPTAATLNAVAFAGTLDGWAVGDQGVIVGTHDGGASWYLVQPALTAQSLRAVRRRSEAVAFAAGIQGVAPRTVAGPDSTVWQLQNAGAAAQLGGVYYPSDLTGYAVGFNGAGAVLRTDDAGVHWQSQIANTQYRLNDVFFVDADRGWAVGDNGTILHTATGGTP